MGFGFRRFQLRRHARNTRSPGPALDLRPLEPPVDDTRIKALARDRFARADQMMSRLSTDPGSGEARGHPAE